MRCAAALVGVRMTNEIALAERADRMRALVEDLEILLRRIAVANAIEDVQERLVALAEHLIELEQRHAGPFGERRHLKEERAAELVFEVLGDLAPGRPAATDAGRRTATAGRRRTPRAGVRG